MAGYKTLGDRWIIPENFYKTSPVWVVVNNWYFGWVQLDGADSTQSQTMDVPVCSYTGPVATPSVTPAEATQNQVMDVPGAKGISLVTCAEATQSQTGDVPSVKGICVVTPAEASQSQVGDAPGAVSINLVTPAESTQSQAMDSATGISIYVISPVDGSQTQVMDEAICAFFAGSTTATVTPEDGYQAQFMDLVRMYVLGDTGFGTRKPIDMEGLSGIAQDKNYPQFAEMSAQINSGGLHGIEPETREVIKSRG
jgi:hypothetical protein